MNRTDRLAGIVFALQTGRMTAAQLAARFEVSRRTILRDIDALSQVGIPLIAMPGAGGGYEVADSYWLQPIHFNATEATALLLASESLTLDPAGPFAAACRSAVDKLSAAIQPRILSDARRELASMRISSDRVARPAAAFPILRQALIEQHWVEMSYLSHRRLANHTILPRQIVKNEDFWYCLAISHDARASRRYRIDRIEAISPVATPIDAVDVIAAASSPQREYDDPGHPEVVVWLTAHGLRRAEDLPHVHDGLKQLDPENWELRFRCPEREFAYWSRTFLGFGPEARVVAPEELVRLVVALVSQTAAAYEMNDRNGDR